MKSAPSQNCTMVSFFEGIFPESWQKALIILIPKPNGEGMRPISLLSCFLKILEKIFHTRLTWYVESNCLLSGFQSGFRADRSCADNLTSLFSFIHTGLLRGKLVIGAFLDIQSAFDVIPSILSKDLNKIGIPKHMRRFIENLIVDRKTFFVIDGEVKGPFNAQKGTPQGSILSPLLFNIYLKDLGKQLPDGAIILQYADDIVILSAHTDPRSLKEIMQKALNSVFTFLKEA